MEPALHDEETARRQELEEVHIQPIAAGQAVGRAEPDALVAERIDLAQQRQADQTCSQGDGQGQVGCSQGV